MLPSNIPIKMILRHTKVKNRTIIYSLLKNTKGSEFIQKQNDES